ncbi:MAG: hypothetical protein HC796_11520 [Synechococcaceae cyanobacterium RL_1_2]|nr:hypothetical protein [Synechococcaceae cyanobacterium RL_1_2]
MVLPADLSQPINLSADFGYPLNVLIISTGLGMVVLTGWGLSCWLNYDLSQLGRFMDGITSPDKDTGLGGNQKEHNPRLQEFTALDHKVLLLAQTVAQLRKDLGHLRDRHDAELMAAKQETEIANRAKSAFIGNMSHELRTPLNSIMVSAQILEMDHDLSMEAQEYVTIIYQSGQNLLQLINNLIDLSRLDNHQFKVELQTIELKPLLMQLKTLFNPKAKPKGLMLSFYLGDRVPLQFQSDPLRLKEILTNLIRNAIQYTDRGTVIINVDLADSNPIHQGPSSSYHSFPPLQTMAN